MTRKVRAWGPFLESPEKPFEKLRPACSVKLVFSYVVKGIKIKITAKCRASRRLRFEDTKRIMSPEYARKVSGLSRNRPLNTDSNSDHFCEDHSSPFRSAALMYNIHLFTWYIQIYIHHVIIDPQNEPLPSWPDSSADGTLHRNRGGQVPNPRSGAVSRKFRKLSGPEKLFVKLRTAHSVKLAFSFVVKGIKMKATVWLCALRRLRSEDTKRIMSLEMHPKKFSGLSRNRPQARSGYICYC